MAIFMGKSDDKPWEFGATIFRQTHSERVATDTVIIAYSTVIFEILP